MRDTSGQKTGATRLRDATLHIAAAFVLTLCFFSEAASAQGAGSPAAVGPAAVGPAAGASGVTAGPVQTPPLADASRADPNALTVTKTTTTTVTKADAPGAAVVHTDLPADLSVEGMFRAADPLVKGVMGLLAVASVATWSIFFYKFVELFLARSQARSGVRAIAGSDTLAQVSNTLKTGAVARLARSAELELQASETLPADGIKERVAIALQRVEAAAVRRIGAGTGILASVGSTGPFVGLFGTVWGIMNSFIHISNAHTTNLSVVAPGIAEALLATAMGLVAAIPAVLIYNMFSRAIASYRAILGDATAGIMRHVSRDLDRAGSQHYAHVAAE